MVAVCILYIIVIFLLMLGCVYTNKKFKQRVFIHPLYFVFGIFLILFATFRSPRLPDYMEYMKLFHTSYTNSSDDKELSFYIICSIAKLVSLNDGKFLFLLIYAVLGISIKLIAIKKYSVHVILSLCVWLSSFFILHDLIQIRASVASGLLLLFLPQVQKRNMVKAFILFIFAFYFLYSALIFLLFFVLNPKTIKLEIWTFFYLISLFINIFNIDIFVVINKILDILPINSINSRLSVYLMNDYTISEEQTNMFSPYIIMQTIICFVVLFSIRKIAIISPYAIIWLKSCFLSIYIYSLSIPGVTMRLAELLSVPQIFLVPLIINCFPNKYKKLGILIVSLICILWLSYFVIIQNFFNLRILSYN